MKRFIFDLDGTLLNGNFILENEYFESVLSKEDAEKFIPVKYSLLLEYEKYHLNYDKEKLSKFISKKINIEISLKMISEWIDVNSNMEDEIDPSAFEVLEYLKQKNKSIAVLTNWFSKSQSKRLKNAGLLEYFDQIYGGEEYLKPNYQSYINASGKYNLNDCIMIGDTLEKDFLGPKQIGMNAIYYNKDSDENTKNVVKTLRKIKEIY